MHFLYKLERIWLMLWYSLPYWIKFSDPTIRKHYLKLPNLELLFSPPRQKNTSLSYRNIIPWFLWHNHMCNIIIEDHELFIHNKMLVSNALYTDTHKYTYILGGFNLYPVQMFCTQCKLLGCTIQHMMSLFALTWVEVFSHSSRYQSSLQA